MLIESFVLCLLAWGVLSVDPATLEDTFNPDSDINNLLRRLAATIDCNNIDFIEDQQVCYTVNLIPDSESDFFFSCDSASLSRENSHPLSFQLDPDTQINHITFSSPNFPLNYPNNTICFYDLPICPNAQAMQHLQWTDETFELEEANDFFFFRDFCSDLVQLDTTTSRQQLCDSGAVLETALGESEGTKILCGDQGTVIDDRSGNPIRVIFFSGADIMASGFRMTVQCADAPNTPLPAFGPGFVPPLNVTADGNRVEVPREAFITYRDKTVRVVQRNSTELVRFDNISRLFFWTGFNGTRVFENSFVRVGEIFGEGTLLIVNGCAYYTTYSIPERFVPNEEEVVILSIIYDATAVFFPGFSPPPTPPPRPHPHHLPYKLPETLPFGFDFEAVRVACANLFSPNPFVRQAIEDYFILLGLNPCILPPIKH